MQINGSNSQSIFLWPRIWSSYLNHFYFPCLWHLNGCSISPEGSSLGWVASRCTKMSPFSAIRYSIFKSDFKHNFQMCCQVLQKNRKDFIYTESWINTLARWNWLERHCTLKGWVMIPDQGTPRLWVWSQYGHVWEANKWCFSLT